MRTLLNVKIREMPRSARLLFVVIATLVTVAIGLILWAVVSSHDWKGLVLNLGTEIIGAVLIYLLLGQLVQRTQRAEEEMRALEAREKQRKEDLIAQLGSSVRDVAVAAAEELKRYGWTKDGSLEGVSLDSVDLRGADLTGANLSRARLYDVKLSGVALFEANLSKAYMLGANLSEANLSEANLSEANLSHTDLSNANLSGADLRGADLRKANLSGAFFEIDMRDALSPNDELERAELEDFVGGPLEETPSSEPSLVQP